MYLKSIKKSGPVQFWYDKSMTANDEKQLFIFISTLFNTYYLEVNKKIQNQSSGAIFKKSYLEKYCYKAHQKTSVLEILLQILIIKY